MGMMMKIPIESFAAQVAPCRDFDSPPLHLWHPPLSGDIAICINAQGIWSHDGDKINRESLVRLFASILRREADGEYYLVTPSEKWRIDVVSHPLLVTDIELLEVAGATVLEATLNTGRRIVVSEQNSLFLDPVVGDIAALNLPHGLTALCSRPVWYRLVDLAEIQEDGKAILLKSGEFEFRLPSA
jgi:uncharacterized protein